MIIMIFDVPNLKDTYIFGEREGERESADSANIAHHLPAKK